MKTYPPGTNIDTIFKDIYFTQYMQFVFEKLEYIGYPPYVEAYEAKHVAKILNKTINSCFNQRLSPMLCAVLIFSLTLTEKVIPDSQKAVKH